MKTKFQRFSISGLILLLAASVSLAQNSATNLATSFATNILAAAVTNAPVPKSSDGFEGEQLLLPAHTKEKLKLTAAQRAEFEPIEKDFAATSQEYQAANQPRLDAAIEANRQARVTKDVAQIQAARAQLQQLWAGLQPDRAAAVIQIKPLLTPDQLKILEDPKNQWSENPAATEPRGPSAN